MKKQVAIASFVLINLNIYAQQDSIKTRQIEDVNLHKTGNPNKAKSLTTKSNLTIMETPQPVAIVTHEIIEQQQSKQLSDVLQNVNGLYISSSRGNSQDSFGGRGFSLGNDNIYKNGSRVNSGVFPEVSGLERVEVLKGSNAMLYGNTSAGGVINMITKKPRFNFGGSIGLNAGSWNSYKPTVDFYGPLSNDVAFRVNGAYEYSDSFRDVVHSEKYYFNPSFLINLGAKSQLIIEADYLQNNFTPDFGIGGIENKDKSYLLNTKSKDSDFFGANWQYQNVEQLGANITFNTQVNSKWTLNTTASFQNYTKDYFSTERLTWKYDNNDRLFWSRPLNRTYNEQNYGSLQFNLNGKFNTGSIQHKLLLGADADYATSDSYTYYNPDNNKNYGTSYIYGSNGGSGNLYLDDPSTWESGAIPNASTLSRNRIPTQRLGVYVQDLISLTDEFKVLAGLRWSYIENKSTKEKNFKNGTAEIEKNGTSTKDMAFSPKVGLIYTPNEDLSLFATYTNSFSNNTGRDINLNPLDPTTIDQYEVGLKKNIFKNALSFNISLYHILYNKYYGQAQFDVSGNANSDTTIKEFIGKMKSQGVEVDVTGNPTQNLSIIGGFSYNHAVYSKTPDLPNAYIENQRLVRTPATTANLALFYKFNDALRGFKIGAGAYYVGSRFGGWNDTKGTLNTRANVTRMLKVDPYTTFSVSAGYDWKKLSLQARVNNLFNDRSYNVHENYSVNQIVPRNFYVTLIYKL